MGGENFESFFIFDLDAEIKRYYLLFAMKKTSLPQLNRKDRKPRCASFPCGKLVHAGLSFSSWRLK